MTFDSQQRCLTAPYEWDMGNNNRSQSAASWEADMWLPGQPDCGIVDGRYESCAGLAEGRDYKMNDYSCFAHVLCPLCQLDSI